MGGLWTVSRSNFSPPAGVVNRFTSPTFILSSRYVQSNETHLKFVNNPPYRDRGQTANQSAEVIKISTQTSRDNNSISCIFVSGYEFFLQTVIVIFSSLNIFVCNKLCLYYQMKCEYKTRKRDMAQSYWKYIWNVDTHTQHPLLMYAWNPQMDRLWSGLDRLCGVRVALIYVKNRFVDIILPTYENVAHGNSDAINCFHVSIQAWYEIGVHYKYKIQN